MQTPKEILVTFSLTDAQKILLERAAPGIPFRYAEASELTPQDASKATVVLGSLPLSLMPYATNLQWMQLHFSGVEAYLRPNVVPATTILTSATGAYGQSVAEHAFAMLFALQKRLPAYRDNQNQHLWQYQGTVLSLTDATVLVVGLGDIGSYFAAMVRPLAKKVIGIRHRNIPSEVVDEVYTMDTLDSVLPVADVILFCLPETPQTQNILSKERIAVLKETAIVLNVGRGSAIDTDALCEALAQNKLWGAGLDVVNPEPLPETHPLWNLKNALITPHSSGQSSLPATVDKVVTICAKNLRRYLAGEPLQSEISTQLGYAETHE